MPEGARWSLFSFKDFSIIYKYMPVGQFILFSKVFPYIGIYARGGGGEVI